MSSLVKKIDILGHSLVPKHRVLTKDEKEELLNKLNISDVQLPLIKIKDPIVKAINANERDVIEIERTISTGTALFYRLVVK